MQKISRRNLLKISGPAAVSSLIGIPVLKSMAGENDPELTKKLKVIVVGAHPDDPETGCGGTMALFAGEGHEVVSAYLTRGEAGIAGKTHDEAASIRTAEALKACGILGARPEFLGQIDGNCEITKERYQVMSDFFKKEKPDIIFTHWPIDTHRDHRVCSVLVYDAWLNSGRKQPLYYFEVMTGQQTQNFVPTDYTDITPFVEQKHKACFIHLSQKIEEEYPKSHGKMEIFRGLEYNAKYAEAFVRHVQSPGGF